MLEDLASRILEDCRGVVGEVRFGFGSKRQVWAFEERHHLDVAGLVERLAGDAPGQFLELALAFHDEFALVSNAWRVRDVIQRLVAEHCRRNDSTFLERVAGGLVDEHLTVRHWLVSAFLAGPPLVAFRGLEEALCRAYQPRDQWALLNRLRSLAEGRGWQLGPEAARVLAGLAQFSARPEERRQALELLARLGGRLAHPSLRLAAQGDADASVRRQAAGLLTHLAG